MLRLIVKQHCFGIFGFGLINKKLSAERRQLRPTMCHESLPFDVS